MKLVHRVLDGRDTAPCVLTLPHAVVAAFSTRAPDKTGPNEDGFAVLEDGARVVVAVADGAGGHAAGDTASRSALDALVASLGAEPGQPVRVGVLNAFEAAHAAIAGSGSGAGTTFVVVELDGDAVRTYHTGDSGVLVTGGRGRLKLQTVSHSPTGYGVEAGLLGEAEALHHDERHVVSNLLGKAPMSVEVGTPLTLARRDTIVVASDGLFDNAYPEEIAERVRSGPLDVACAALTTLVQKRMRAQREDTPSKPDDLTVVLMRRTP